MENVAIDQKRFLFFFFWEELMFPNFAADIWYVFYCNCFSLIFPQNFCEVQDEKTVVLSCQNHQPRETQHVNPINSMEQDLKRLNDSTSELWESGRDPKASFTSASVLLIASHHVSAEFTPTSSWKAHFQLEKILVRQKPMKLYDHATVPNHPFLT